VTLLFRVFPFPFSLRYLQSVQARPELSCISSTTTLCLRYRLYSTLFWFGTSSVYAVQQERIERKKLPRLHFKMCNPYMVQRNDTVNSFGRCISERIIRALGLPLNNFPLSNQRKLHFVDRNFDTPRFSWFSSAVRHCLTVDLILNFRIIYIAPTEDSTNL
jgi:hypothetical protein